MREDVAPSRAGARRPARAHPLRRCLARCAARSSAPSISARRRSSTVDDRARADQGARCRPSVRVAQRRDGRPRVPRRAAVAVRQGERPRDRTALSTTEARAWLRSRSPASPSASADARRRPRSTSRIGDGEFVVLLGPTGAGKTTTLRLVAGLERPDAGTIRIGGRDVTARRAGRARRRLRLPAIFALSASLGLRQPRLPAALAGAPRAGGRDRAGASRRWRRLLRIDHKLEEPRDAAFRRRDAARRDRPRAGAPARRST